MSPESLGDLCRDASLRKRAMSHGKGPFCDKHRGGDSSANTKRRSWGRKELAVLGPEESLTSNVSYE